VLTAVQRKFGVVVPERYPPAVEGKAVADPRAWAIEFARSLAGKEGVIVAGEPTVQHMDFYGDPAWYVGWEWDDDPAETDPT
jgi:hypothetical protein